MASKQKQITNSALYVLPILVGNVVPLITLPIFTRLLSPADFGAWALANVYAVVVGGIATVGLPIAYERNFFEYRKGRQASQLLYAVVGFAVVAFAVVGLATWLFSEPLSRWVVGDLRYQRLVVWSFWTSAVVGVKAFYLTYLRNSERAAAFSTCMIAERLMSAVLALVLVAGAGIGVMGLVIGQLLASAAVLAVLIVWMARELPPAFDRRLLTDSLTLGYPLTPRILLGAVGNNFDKYLIGQLESLGGVGVYTIGQRVANIAFTYTTALQNVFGPQVYALMFSGGPEAGVSIGRYLTPFAYISTALAFAVALFSEEILTVLAPADYAGAVPIVTIFAVHYAIMFFGKMPQITFARKTHFIAILAAVGTALNIALGVVCIRLWGTVGAAWGVLIVGAIMATLGFIVGQRCFRIEWESRKLLAMFALLIAAAFLTLVMQYSGVSFPVRLSAKALLVAAFIWLGVRLRVVTAGNLALARDLILRRRSVIQTRGEAAAPLSGT